jgi:H+/Cl- antiporter ClcA
MTGGAMTSTTSGIALTDLLKGALIASIALIASLVATELLSLGQNWSMRAAAAVIGINVTLLVIFCISVAFNVARLI